MSTEERVRKAPDWAVLSSAAGFTIWGFSLLLTRVGQRYASPMVLLSVFCSIAANMLVNYGAGRISVTKMSAIGNINTVISAFAGVVFLREPFTWVMLLGAVLVLTGVREVTKQGV